MELKVNGAVVFEAARSLARMRCRMPVMGKSDDSFEDILSVGNRGVGNLRFIGLVGSESSKCF